MLPAALLRIPVASAACAVNFLGLFGLYAVLFELTSFFQEDQHLTPAATGIRFLALTAAIALAAVAAPSVASLAGTRATMIAGALLVAAGLAGLVRVGQGNGFAEYGWALVLLGADIPLSAGVVAVAAVMKAVPPALAGTTSGGSEHVPAGGRGIRRRARRPVHRRWRDGPRMHRTVIVAAAGALLGAASVYGTLRPRITEQARGLPGR